MLKHRQPETGKALLNHGLPMKFMFFAANSLYSKLQAVVCQQTALLSGKTQKATSMPQDNR